MAYDRQGYITRKLINEMETMDSDEWDKYYEELDWEHQMKVDDAVERFSNRAIGDDHWDSDD
ncbi:MAG: hypothetical protein IKN95_00375 [Lachnospiraceae bacterium]|nr:hypothetical protein [Lachnospiraceae bacterium]